VSGPWIAAFVVLWIVVVLVLLVVVGVLRRALAVLEGATTPGGTDHRAVSAEVVTNYGGAPPGTRIPPFAVENGTGAALSSDELLGRARLYVFVTAGCPPCERLVAELASSPGGEEMPIVLFAHDRSDVKVASLPPSVTVLEQPDGSASRAFQTKTFPQAFAVNADGLVQATAIPNSLSDLRMLARALEGGDRRDHPHQASTSS
jgi:hypothetical protein